MIPLEVMTKHTQLAFLLLLPILSFLGAFYYLPLVSVVKVTLNLPFAEILSIFQQPLFSYFLSFTIFQSIYTVLLSLIIGVPTAYLLGRTKPFGLQFLRTMLTVPFLFPSLVIVLGFVILFDTNGFLTQLLNLPFSPFSFWGIVIAHTIYNISVVVRITESAFISDPQEYHEVAIIAGASVETV